MVAAASRKLIGELLLLVLKGVLQLRGDVESEPWSNMCSATVIIGARVPMNLCAHFQASLATAQPAKM